MKRFIYFVSFVQGNGNGHGNCCLKLNQPITSAENIRDVEKLVGNLVKKNVILLNFQFLNEIEEDEEFDKT